MPRRANIDHTATAAFFLSLPPYFLPVGVELERRPLELATLFSDVIKGNFQITFQRWVGANTDPDFFEFAFSSKRFPPDGANRGHSATRLSTRSPIKFVWR